MPTMPKPETPMEFSARCWPVSPSKLAQEVDARDDSLRAESADLLKMCREALEKAQSVKAIVQSIERSEDWSGGEPCLGTCRSFGRIKSISDEASTALAALKEAVVLGAGVNCGCCGKWIPNQVNKTGMGWGLCEECASNKGESHA